MPLHRFRLTWPIGLVWFLACDHVQPVEPVLEARATSSSGSAPTAPSSPIAAAVSDSRIDIGWLDNSTNESGFEVHRSNTGAGGAFSLLAVTGAGVTGYSDGGLAPSTAYCYEVRAVRTTGSKNNYSAFSSAACATTLAPPPPPPPPPLPPPPPPPAAPSGVVATPEGSTTVWVWWTDNSTEEAGFRLERSLDAGVNWTIAATLAADSAYAYDRGRASEQQVCYRVIAFNSGGDSPASDTDCTTPPAGPTDLMVAGPDSATGGVVLTWNDNSSVEDGYEVLSAWEGLVVVAELPANATSYVVPCDFGTYWVRAAKDRFAYAGHSDLSNDVNPSFSPLCPGEPLKRVGGTVDYPRK